MDDALSYLGAAIAVLSTLAKHTAVVRSGRRRTPALRLLLAALLLLGLSLATSTPRTLSLLSALEPMPNAARLASHVLAMAASTCVLAVATLAPARDPRPRRRVLGHVIVLVIAVGAMTAMLMAADTRPSLAFIQDYGHNLLIDAYFAIYAGYMAWGMIAFHRLGRRFFHAPSVTGIGRLAFRFMQSGVVCGLTWVLARAVDVIAQYTGWTIASTPLADFDVLSSACTALLAAGLTCPDWAPAVLRSRAVQLIWQPAEQLRTRIALAKIDLLWKPLAHRFPDLVVDTADQPAGIRLYRHVIEIRDAQLRLMPFTHPGAEETSMQLSRGEPDNEYTQAVAEAAALATGLDAHHAARRPGRTAEVGQNHIDHHRLANDPVGEARHLGHVAVAFRTSRIVRTVRRQLSPMPLTCTAQRTSEPERLSRAA